MKWKYDLTPEDVVQVLALQDNRCAGCGRREPTNRGWCIDHCHESGTVRGVLCSPCNLALGMVADSPAVLEQLARYLRAPTVPPPG